MRFSKLWAYALMKLRMLGIRGQERHEILIEQLTRIADALESIDTSLMELSDDSYRAGMGR